MSKGCCVDEADEELAHSMSRKAVAKKWKFADACDIHSHMTTFSLADITGNNIDTPISTFVERASADN
jgi:hypothetical protein